ncbi:MAG TPA: lysylphosphatidylglycerol synthase transmembrane domain-containing protein [bacterium]|nr:lysylphosphatidylglycerol synthase transmembrane domain-containing protein [bacterium]HOL46681.1 lysylphosphatidylglycerol synthase transmembrane domain-containing protein [bacterium]HPQ18369.1 lysylphosphatidylglycerol synthase transmembrane domain-containing protein [bacterium]
MLKSKKFWFGLIISIICLYYSFKGIKLNEIIIALKQVNYFYLIPALFFVIITLWTRTIRWKFLIKDHQKIKFYDIWVVNCIGFMALFTLPARLGDLLRAYLLGKRVNIKKMMVLSTIVLERVFDGIASILLFLFALILYPIAHLENINNINFNKIIIYISTFYGGVLLVLILIKIFSKQAKIIFSFILHKLIPFSGNFIFKLENFFNSFIEGLDTLGSFLYFIRIIILSIIVWLINGIPAYFTILAFNLPMNFWQAIILNGFLVFAVMIPAAPGFIGTYHITAQLVLSMYNVQGADALSFAWILWLIGFIVDVAAGLFYLYKEKMNLIAIEKEATNE